MSVAAFAFAQARLQAGHARRLDEADWRALEALTRYPVFVQHARETTGAGRWLPTLGSHSDPDAIETELRRAFEAHVDAAAGWVPRPWRPAVRWTLRLLDVPRLLAGEALPDEPESDPLRQTAARGADLWGAWLAGWRRLWPEKNRDLEKLAALLTEHGARFAELAPDADGWAARRELEARLDLSFRRSAFGPGALFAHLALDALELERLRGGLVRRALFHPGKGA